MPGALLTDLYELNMAASYLRRGMRGNATFSLYVRTLPPERGFLVAVGQDAALAFLEGLSFDHEDLAYLASIGFDDASVAQLRELRFIGDVWAVPEGRVVHANEPILEVTASIAVAQLVETFLLNAVTLGTTIASKAVRYRLAADGRDLVDFAMRRTHGIEASIVVARASAIAGFAATSNVEAARRLDLTPTGTMAHAYVESFPGEREAFEAFAEDFPERSTFLVDTYDTLGGVRTAIDVIRERRLTDGLGVRLDSGDLDALSRGARTLLDDAGLPEVRIVASGGLDERDVASLVAAGAPIDAFGVGTQLGVSYDAPSLESVYKLVRYDGRQVVKLSSGKQTLPGEKQVFRSRQGDVLGMRDEDLPGERLLGAVMRDGVRLAPATTVAEARSRLESDLAALPEAVKRLENPERVAVGISAALRAAAAAAREDAVAHSGT
jgi:nicotinate phosphoribosyltransferase